MIKRRFLSAVFIVVSALTLVSCSFTVDFIEGESTVVKLEQMSVNDIEVKLVALSYKNRYENYYSALLGAKFWDEEVSEGVSFERFLISDSILNELETVLALNVIARKEKITLSSEELQDLEEKAGRIYSEMTEDAKGYTGAKEKNILSVLKKYQLAYDAEQFLLADSRIEISDEMSRVVETQVIHTKTSADAETIYERLTLGEDFGTLAKENTIDDRITYAVSREDLSETFDTILFSLEEGEVSPVVSYRGEGFIFRIQSSYSMLLSKSNKHNLLAKTRYESLWQAVESYRIPGTVQVNHPFFEALSLKTEGDYAAFSLF